MHTIDHDRAIALLDFYVTAGVDLALDDAPHDRFAESEAPESAQVSPARLQGTVPARERRTEPMPSAPPAPATVDATIADARARAASAGSLEELRALLDAFDGCSLKRSARQLVFADGEPGARVMFLGEAPGADEDRIGTPFVGRAGRLLDRMLAAIGLDRTAVYIANIVPWRPPGNRTPTPQEASICLPFALRQIELARPEILVTLGAPATQAVLATTEGITRMRGRLREQVVGTHALRVLPMLHPAYLLRQPAHKRFAWRDLRLLRAELDRQA